eukprot:symbB.v1.2.020579.t1/scaffold1737.1/size104095/3
MARRQEPRNREVPEGWVAKVPPPPELPRSEAILVAKPRLGDEVEALFAEAAALVALRPRRNTRLQVLEEEMQRHGAAKKIGTAWRQKAQHRQQKAAQLLQNHFRGWRARRVVQKEREKQRASRLQRWWRKKRFYLAWLQTHQQRKAAVKLQAFHRGNKARQEVYNMLGAQLGSGCFSAMVPTHEAQKQQQSARKIQVHWRWHRLWQAYLRQRAAMKVQTFLRGVLARWHLVQLAAKAPKKDEKVEEEVQEAPKKDERVAEEVQEAPKKDERVEEEASSKVQEAPKKDERVQEEAASSKVQEASEEDEIVVEEDLQVYDFSASQLTAFALQPRPKDVILSAESWQTFLELTRRIGRGNWLLAVEVLDVAARQTTRYDVRAFNTALSVCKASSSGWLASSQFLEQLKKKGLEPSVVSYGACMATASVSYWRNVFQLLQDTSLTVVTVVMHKCHRNEDVICYSSAISACEKAKQWMQALALICECQEISLEVNVITYNATISACGGSGQWQRALQLFADCNTTLKPSIVTYNAVISACETASCWALSLVLLDTLVMPDVVSFSATISACGKAGEWMRALDVLSVCYASTSPNTIVLNAGISACERRSVWQQALLLLRRSQLDRLADGISFSCSISACQKSRRWQEAIETLCASSGFWNLISINATISAVGVASWQLATELACAAQARLGSFRRVLPVDCSILVTKLVPSFDQANMVTLTALVSAVGLAWRKGLWFLSSSVGRRILPSTALRAARTGVAKACGQAWLQTVHLLEQEEDVVACGLQVETCEAHHDIETAQRAEGTACVACVASRRSLRSVRW